MDSANGSKNGSKKPELVNELRKRFEGQLEPEMNEDERFLYRFLKDRDFNVDAAEIMLKKHLKWRQKYDVKNILKYKLPEVLVKYVRMSKIGHTNKGYILRYIPTGNIDWIGIILSCKLEDIIKLMIYDVEMDNQELQEHSKKIGKTVDKGVYIHNMENFSFVQATNKQAVMSMLTLFSVYLNNYPERIKAIYVINVSMYFSIIFSVIKPILSNTLMRKIKIYSDDSWKEDLLNIAVADELPAFLGGNRTDPDGNPLCLSFVHHGEPIPETYYIHKSKRSLANSPGTERVTLTRAAFQEVKLEVKEPGSYLEWEFETKCRDIGFGLFYQEIIDGEEKNTELVPLQRMETAEFAETGMYMCEKEGTYVIVFDNTYSWVRGKEIFYRIKVVSPEEQEMQSSNE